MADLHSVFLSLRAILLPYAGQLLVRRDEASEFYLDTRHVQENQQPLFFAAVQVRKSAVSFHLMPVYLHPALLQGLSQGLKRRMQGKSCFNFKAGEPALFAELEALVEAGFARYRALGYV